MYPGDILDSNDEEKAARFDKGLQCFDPYMYERLPVHKYFEENNAAILLVVASSASSPLTYACVSKEAIRVWIGDDTNTFLDCRDNGSQQDRVMYNKLPIGDSTVYATQEDVSAILRVRTQRIFLVAPPHKTLPRVISLHAYNEKEDSYVGGEHCQTTSKKKISRIVKMAFGHDVTGSDIELRARKIIDEQVAASLDLGITDWSKLIEFHRSKLITNDQLAWAVKHMPNLRSVDIIGDGIAKSLKLLAKLEHLENLYVSDRNCTDNDIMGVDGEWTGLTVLSLSGSSKVTNKGVKALADKFPDLLVLDIPMFFNLTDEGIQYLAGKLTKLQKLFLNHCSITDKGIEAIANNLPDLTSLNITGCTHVTGTGFMQLKKLTKLVSLDISDNKHVGDAVVETLSASLKDLKSLDLVGSSVTAKGRRNALVTMSQLEIHY
jgi:hypothetical protein